MSKKIAKPYNTASAPLARIKAKTAESLQAPFGKGGWLRSGGAISTKQGVPA